MKRSRFIDQQIAFALRQGWAVNHKRVYRLYCLEGLQMRPKPPRRRGSAKLRDDRTDAIRPHQCWFMDFMADELFDGRRLRLLTIVDNFSRVSFRSIKSPGKFHGQGCYKPFQNPEKTIICHSERTIMT